jgi:hypothetical protein
MTGRLGRREVGEDGVGFTNRLGEEAKPAGVHRHGDWR